MEVPPARQDAAEAERQKQAFVEAMKPRRPGKPVIAVLTRNQATETTDFLLTHAVLQRSGVAEVQAVAPRRGRVSLYPALEVEVAQDLDGFDKSHPSGADYVVVPAMEYEKSEDPVVTAWLRRQAELGARIVSVCAGALVVARAGLLDGRRFTTHWYFVGRILDHHPTAVYAPHQRYVVDQNVVTSTGITATVPTVLALVEAIGGSERARQVAAELGVDSWTPRHDSSRFGLDAARRWNYVLTKLLFWRREHRTIAVRDGTDDIALAFSADAWSRTGLVDVEASAPGPVKLRSGLTLLTRPRAEGTAVLLLASTRTPVQQLDRTLCEIEQAFGPGQRVRVMQELEYPGSAACPR